MEKRDLIFAGATLCAMFVLYFISNVPHETMYDLSTFLDDYIPLVPLFIFPYSSYFILIPSTMFGVARNSIYQLRLFLIMFLGTILFSHACFWCFPTHLTVRPVISETDLFSQLTNFLYSIDAPYSACPSLHANVSTLCAIFWWRMRHRYSYIMVAWAGIVIVSTVFLKQHFLLDVPAGIASAILWYQLVSLGARAFQAMPSSQGIKD